MLALSHLLGGNAQVLATPPAEAQAGEYTAGMIGVVALICALAAEEAEGAAARLHAENEGMRALLAGTAFAEPAGEAAVDLRLSALTAAGDRLRERLIALHIAAEDADDTALEHAILRFLHRSATTRRLTMPIQPAG